MSTAYGPIGFALRDIGSGFGELLKSEAERRDAGLRREVALGQIGIQKAQAEAQGQQGLAQVGVQQAQTELSGRQFDIRQQFAEQEAQRNQFNTIATRGLEGQRLGLEEQRLTLEGQKFEAQKPLITAQATAATSQARAADALARVHTATAIEAESAARLGEEHVNASELIRTLQKANPQAAELGVTLQALVSPHGTAGNYYTSPEGDTYVPRNILERNLATIKPFQDLLKRGNAPTFMDIQKTVQEARSTMTDIEKQAPGNSQEHLTAKMTALAFYPAEYSAEVQRIETKDAALYRKDLEDAFKARYGHAPQWSQDSAKNEVEIHINRPLSLKIEQEKIKAAYRYSQGKTGEMATGLPAAPTVTPPGGPAPTASQDQASLETFTGQAATEVGLRPAEGQALFRHESNFRNVPNAQYGARSGTGPAQVIVSTFQQYARPGEDINNATDNIRVGLRYLAALKREYSGDLRRAYAAYNAGPGKIPKEGPIPETVQYGDIVTHPRAFADRVMAELQQRDAPSPPGLAGRTLPPVITNAPQVIRRGLSDIYRTLSTGGTLPAPAQASPYTPGLAGAGLSETDRLLSR